MNVSQKGNCFWKVCQEIDSAATTAALSVARPRCVTIQNNHRHVDGLGKKGITTSLKFWCWNSSFAFHMSGHDDLRKLYLHKMILVTWRISRERWDAAWKKRHRHSQNVRYLTWRERQGWRLKRGNKNNNINWSYRQWEFR